MGGEITFMIISALTRSMREHPIRWLLYSGVSLLVLAAVFAAHSSVGRVAILGAALIIAGIVEIIARDE